MRAVPPTQSELSSLWFGLAANPSSEMVDGGTPASGMTAA